MYWSQTVKNGITLLWNAFQDYCVELLQTIKMTIIAWIVSIYSEPKVNFNHMWMCAKIIIIVTSPRYGTKFLSLFRIINLWRFHLLSMQTFNFCSKYLSLWQWSNRIVNIKNKQTNGVWLFILLTLFIW